MSDLKRVNVYKIKPNNSFDSILKGSLSDCDRIECSNGTFEGYIKYNYITSDKDETKIPWLTFLNEAPNEKNYEYRAKNKYPRAILVLKISQEDEENFYAFTFGQHGDSFLSKDKIIRDFGIKVGMNICDVEKLRRVQTTIHESISQQTERQSSTGTSLGVFNINNESEFLKTISGYVKNEYRDLIDSFRGRDNITLKLNKGTSISWNNIVEICNRLNDRYHAEDYRGTEFSVYDVLRFENDLEIVDNLNTLLCTKISNKDFTKIHLAPPEFLREEEVSFAYKEYSEDDDFNVFNDLFIADIVNQPRRRLTNLKVSTLKAWKIFKYDNEHQKTYCLWNAYECIVAEIDYDGKTYILSNSQWREVSEELKTTIKEYFSSNDVVNYSSILPEGISIYDSTKRQNREDVYNETVVETMPNLYLFDRSKITIGGQKKYEVCDIFSNTKDLIHVKRYSFGAASISHLFTQGKFYAQAFSTEIACRKGMREWLMNENSIDQATALTLIPNKNSDVNEHDFTIVFCILHNQESFTISDLPLMSQYELMNSHKYLTQDRKFNCNVVFRKVKLDQSSKD